MLVFGLSMTGRVSAQTIAGDRPGFGDGSAIVPAGRFQVESGYAYTEGGPIDQHSIGQLLVRVGVAPRVELRGGFNSYVVKRGLSHASGFEDFSVGGKVNLLPGDGMPLGEPTVTAIVSASLPTGNDRFSSHLVRPQTKLAIDWGLSESASLSVNAGYDFTFKNADSNQLFTYVALGSSIPGTHGFGVFAGLYSRFPHSGNALHDIDGGFTFLPSRSTQLDVSLGVGLTQYEPDYVFGFGVAHLF